MMDGNAFNALPLIIYQATVARLAQMIFRIASNAPHLNVQLVNQDSLLIIKENVFLQTVNNGIHQLPSAIYVKRDSNTPMGPACLVPALNHTALSVE